MGDFELGQDVLRLTGPLEMAAFASRQREFLRLSEELLAQASDRDPVLDLSAAGRLASTAIGLAVAVARRAEEQNRHLVVRVSRSNAAAIGLTGLPQVARLELV